MRLEKIQDYLKQRKWEYQYAEENGCGSIDWLYRGISYHIWEFMEEGPGAESNVKSAARMIDYLGDYEDDIIAELKKWPD